jgi:hypothetical protein
VIVALVAISNIVLGVAYTAYGMMTAIEMKRDWRTFGFSHFGAAWIYLGVIGAACALVLAGHRVTPGFAVWANVILVGLYMAVGWFVLRTQLANRPSMGGWSVSGLSLSVIFPTCALMHAVWATYAVAGRYQQDGHGLVIDWLSVPAGLYFLAVVRGLYRESLRDWNDGPGEVTAEVSTPHAHPTRVGGLR